MNPERPELIEHLKTKTDEDLKWDTETKRKLHDWIVQQTEAGHSYVDIHRELAKICENAGLKEESYRQYIQVMELIIQQAKEKI